MLWSAESSVYPTNVIRNSEEHITLEGLESSAAKIMPQGTVLIAMYGQGKTRGKVALLAIEAAINQACVALLPNQQVLPAYTFHALSAEYRRLRALSQGNTQENLNQDLIRKFPIPVPDIHIQRQCVARMSSVEDALTSNRDQANNLRVLKAGLLQALLSGRVRVKLP